MRDTQEPIAIVGIGCRFPGGSTPQEFWQLLCEGRCAVREVPAERWKMDQLYDPDPTIPGKTVSRWGGIIEKIDQFDWQMFHIAPREAKFMDPQQRLLLEVAWEALEDAGLPLAQVAGSRTSVFIGMSWSDYFRLQARNWSMLDGYSILSAPPAFAANRISYFFDLKGPSISLDAGCTSSLASVYLACQSLWSGEATLALAGAVNLMLSPDSLIMASKAGLLSPDGYCKTLDAQASGCVRGEGAGIIVLKPLSLVQDSDRIYALIRGIAINHNGHNEWIMAASASAQEQLLRDVYQDAHIDPAMVDYVELHGTGYLRGDALETQALGAVLGGAAHRVHPCLIGSVKTNIGHLEAASGIASIIKVALSLYHRTIPPTLHLQTINPAIPLHSLHLAPQQVLTPWPAKEGYPVAAVNTISLTGANAHAILEGVHSSSCDTCTAELSNDLSTRILPLSAQSEQALRDRIVIFRNFLAVQDDATPNLWRDICYTTSVRRTHHVYRLAVNAASTSEAMMALDTFLLTGAAPHLAVGHATPNRQPKIMFLFPHDLNSQRCRNCACFLHIPAFRAALDECDSVFQLYTGRSLRQDLDRCFYAIGSISDSTIVAPHVVFAIQVALAALWCEWGIKPSAVLGVGQGELAAAYVAGALNLDDAMRVLIASMNDLMTINDWKVLLADLKSSVHYIPVYSAAIGTISENQHLKIAHWEKRFQPPSFFAVDIFDELAASGYNTFVEQGPPSTLSEKMLAHLQHHDVQGTIVASLSQEKEQITPLMDALIELYTKGCAINWSTVNSTGKCISLPPYPWQRERLWLDWLSVDKISTPPELLVESHVLAENKAAWHGHFIQLLEEASPEKQRHILLAHITDLVVAVLGLPSRQAVQPQQKFFEIGMDSITATQLANHLQADLGQPLSAITVFNYPTIEKLTNYLASEVLALEQPCLPSKGEFQHEQSELANLSETEAEALLIEKLSIIERRL